ncbi:MAG TPA: pyruvate carboxylase subunit B [Dehalococcoidia bacterium]|nr:pyruvate carboxylase subunit B [Dehalococcoidia bacterium]
MSAQKQQSKPKPKQAKTGAKAKNPLKICDTTFRDAHQSSFATRLRIEDMEAIAPEMDKVGFHAMEVWGGATFDVCTRFLNEDPWDRVRRLKRLMPNTPLQMLLRGQNLVGYRNYADDVVKAFVDQSAEVGIDIFRVFDALNDERNVQASFKEIKACRKHIQACLSFSLTENKLGGPVYTIDYYVNKALIFQDMGADSICIKDMAGLLSPYDAYDLITALKAKLRIPVELHNHYTSGMASMTCLKAVEAGVDIIDTALAPFALRSSQPAIEPIVAALQGTPRDCGLDLSLLLNLGEHFEAIAPKYRSHVDTSKMSIIDTGVLMHQVPGGMTTNLVSQLKEADALDRLHEVHEELPKVRKELGYPPLVTPTSQIVGIQAVQNVLFGRYKMISGQVKDYIYGMYGRSPAPIDPKVQKIALKGYERGEKPITCRAADMLEPEMEKAKEATKDIAKDIGDVLIYALYPQTGMKFLRWKYGLEPVPDSVKPKTLEQVKKEDELIAKALSGKLVEKGEKEAPPKGPGIRTFNVFVEDEYYKVEVEPTGASTVTGPVVSAAPVAAQPAPKTEAPPQPAKAPVKAPTTIAEGEVAVLVPMPGTVIRYQVKEGDRVKSGDVVVLLEAMKMENAIPAPTDGVIKKVNYGPGASVKKGEVLAIIDTKA